MFHLVEKSIQRTVPVNLFDSPVKKLYLKKVKRLVYSWANGTSCSCESQYLFSKSLLLHELQVNQQVRSALDSSAIDFILTWLNSKLFPHENTYVFWKKTYIRCLDEYMNNSAEAMNKSCKKSDISAKPNMSMDKAANAMLTYTQLQTRVCRSTEAKNLLSTPLFVDPTVHNIHVLEKLSQYGQHLVLNQFVERNNYTVMCTSQNTWHVFRDNIDLSPHSVLDIPRFWNVWKVQKDSNGVFVCQCGYKHRYGIPCRHLFSIEPCYDLYDIDVRWHTDFGHFAYHPQAGLEKQLTTTAGLEEKNFGIRCKKADVPTSRQFPYVVSGKGVRIPQFLQFLNSPHVLCTNYKVEEYPSLAESNVAFTQESTAHEDTLFSLECGAMPRDNMDPTDMLIDEDPQPAFSIPTGTSITQAQLFTFFKDMLPLFNCPSSRHRLLESLSANRTEREIQLKSKKRNVASEGSDTTLVSSNVPFDTARESYQNTYHFKR